MFEGLRGFPRSPIQTPRLTLRRVTMRDAQDMFEYSKDPEVAQHVLWDAHKSISESKAYIRYMLRKYRGGEPASWGIVETATGRLIGTIGYMWYQSDNNAAEVGYSLARDCWNKGYMTEALKAVLRYSFEEYGLNRVEAIHEVSNPASGAVMRKCGMKKEGTLRQKLYNKGRYVDVDLYAILRREWVASGKGEENV